MTAPTDIRRHGEGFRGISGISGTLSQFPVRSPAFNVEVQQSVRQLLTAF